MWMTGIFGTRWSTSILNFNNFEVAYLISFGLWAATILGKNMKIFLAQKQHCKSKNHGDWFLKMWIIRELRKLKRCNWLREERSNKQELNFPLLDYLVKNLSSWLFPQPSELLQYSRFYQARHCLRKFPRSGMIYFLVIIFLLIMVWITFSCREIASVHCAVLFNFHDDPLKCKSIITCLMFRSKSHFRNSYQTCRPTNSDSWEEGSFDYFTGKGWENIKKNIGKEFQNKKIPKAIYFAVSAS